MVNFGMYRPKHVGQTLYTRMENMPIGVMKNGTILVVVALDLPSPRMLGGASKVNHFEFHSYTMTFI